MFRILPIFRWHAGQLSLCMHRFYFYFDFISWYWHQKWVSSFQNIQHPNLLSLYKLLLLNYAKHQRHSGQVVFCAFESRHLTWHFFSANGLNCKMFQILVQVPQNIISSKMRACGAQCSLKHWLMVIIIIVVFMTWWSRSLQAIKCHYECTDPPLFLFI